MKLVNLVNTTLFLLVTSQPLASPNPKSSHIWIDLDLDQCLIGASNTPSPNLAAQQDTARAVIDAYNAWDVDAILAYRSPDCKHRVLPASMNRAAKSNDEYRAYLNTIMPLYLNFTVVVMEEIHDARAHTCIIHASKDGTEVTKFDEFVDSAYSQQFVAALAKEEPVQERNSTGSVQ
ncbi:hypothetical protein PTNB73_01363 [Pyrenophora teres f. teres]|nr:hypothetical protein HRS9122_02634 [Pyrenophora teres f. teres]KAE8874731.1 hypothetical protein PTNB73_01363 [Pyrenophora teres f. teres]